MSFSSPATASTSRSSSPTTPEPSDTLEAVAVRSDFDNSKSWYMHQLRSADVQSVWDIDTTDFISSAKTEDHQMLRLDDLIEQHAYEDSPSISLPSSLGSHTPSIQLNSSTQSLVSLLSNPGPTLVHPPNVSIPPTKPIPPPASLPRKQDPSFINQRVVFPSKESCFNLPIMFPSIPEGGTKSRVETQVRVTVDLADASSSSDPYKYDRIGSWKWLKLPQGTATKKRTRKQGRIDPEPQDILHLSATVTCASPPHNRVLSCSSCQTREAKRVAKKLAARVRPARTDTESDDPSSSRPSKSNKTEDTSSIIQFNCAEVLDFSTGSAVLPLRITCYCRHHREKVGFNVHFTMMDHTGRIVGTGSSRPIMITDDHKTAPPVQLPRQTTEVVNGFVAVDSGWSQAGAISNDVINQAGAPSKRRQDLKLNISAKKRTKPYDSSGKPNRVSREGSVASIPSPSSTFSPLPMTRSPTPSAVLQHFLSEPAPQQQRPMLRHSSHTSDSSSPDTLMTPLDRSPDINTPDAQRPHEIAHAPSSLSIPTSVSSVVMPTHPHPMPFIFFDPHQPLVNMSPQLPMIHRLIPNMGPTHGGIEVTILGSNFHPSLQLNCVFGGVAASSTQRWSDNTLVCILPPRATAGVVAVWFDGFSKVEDQTNTPPCLFTYADESDRALMELALQVVGLKMTGKIEDAKNVAMRIVGGSDGSESLIGVNSSNMMQLASSGTRDLRPLLFVRAGESEDFETLIVDFLTLVDVPLDRQPPNSPSTADAFSYPTSCGQTLLHLAAFLGFSSLLKFLVTRGVDLDARDKSRYTALHFAALVNSEECALTLLEAGADSEIVNAFGKTPAEMTTDLIGMFSTVMDVDSDAWDTDSEDEEAEWGDAEEDDAPAPRRPSKRVYRRTLHHRNTAENVITRSVEVSRASTPPPVSSNSEKKEETISDTQVADAKQAASFIEMIQWTLSQLPAPQGIIPNMPQLPMPHLPHLPGIGMPAVPWGALPQIPLVFPVFVPMMPGWPSLRGGDPQGEDAATGMGAGAIRAAQEWRATWEKWVALAVATTARQQTEDMPPPMYTPRETGEGSAVSEEASQATAVEGDQSLDIARPPVASDIRPIGYDMGLVADQEFKAYEYQPSAKRTQKLQKKHDKMLLVFWLPILLMSFLWALHSGVQFAFHTLKTVFPLKTAVR